MNPRYILKLIRQKNKKPKNGDLCENLISKQKLFIYNIQDLSQVSDDNLVVVEPYGVVNSDIELWDYFTQSDQIGETFLRQAVTYDWYRENVDTIAEGNKLEQFYLSNGYYPYPLIYGALSEEFGGGIEQFADYRQRVTMFPIEFINKNIVDLDLENNNIFEVLPNLGTEGKKPIQLPVIINSTERLKKYFQTENEKVHAFAVAHAGTGDIEIKTYQKSEVLDMMAALLCEMSVEDAKTKNTNRFTYKRIEAKEWFEKFHKED